MELSEKTIGFALTGSFCTYRKVIPEIQKLKLTGANIIPVMSEISCSTDTRFGKALDFINEIEEITENKVITSIKDAEPIGPKKILDLLIVAPCTGNSISKIANGIADTSVTLAVKAHLRNLRPVVIAVSTNDGLSGNAKNIGLLLNRRNIYFVPFGQDDFKGKENSLVAKMDLIIPTIENALEYKQIQPLLV